MNGVFGGLAGRSLAAAGEAELAARRAATKAGQVGTEVELLRHDVEKLLMLTEALWTFLKEQHGYTDEQLLDRLGEIDMRDGRLDGRVAKQPAAECPQCHRLLVSAHSYCLYCSTPLARDPFER